MGQVRSSRTFLSGRLGGRPRLLAGHKNSVCSDVSGLDHKHNGKEKERSQPAAPQNGAPKRLPRAGPSPHSWPLRRGTGNSTAASGPAPGPRPFRGVPAASGASLSTPLLGCLGERGRGRPVSSEVTASRPRGPPMTRAARTADPVPAARARPLSCPGPLPKQRSPRDPLLLLSGRHGPSVAETGTSSRWAPASTKASRHRLRRGARREMKFGRKSRGLHSRRAPRAGPLSAGGAAAQWKGTLLGSAQ